MSEQLQLTLGYVWRCHACGCEVKVGTVSPGLWCPGTERSHEWSLVKRK